jgi:hypothetical protein
MRTTSLSTFGSRAATSSTSIKLGRSGPLVRRNQLRQPPPADTSGSEPVSTTCNAACRRRRQRNQPAARQSRKPAIRTARTRISQRIITSAHSTVARLG